MVLKNVKIILTGMLFIIFGLSSLANAQEADTEADTEVEPVLTMEEINADFEAAREKRKEVLTARDNQEEGEEASFRQNTALEQKVTALRA